MAATICPKCKNEIKDGHVLCGNCGYEIQIVPDFDARVENAMDQALSQLMDGLEIEDLTEAQVETLSKTFDMETTENLKRRIELAKTRDIKEPETASENSDSDKSKGEAGSAEAHKPLLLHPIFLGGILGIIIAAAAVLIISNYQSNNSSKRLLERAGIASAEGNHEQALGYLDAAAIVEPDNFDIKVQYAKELILSGRDEDAQNYINKLLEEDDSYDLYDILAGFFVDRQEYDKLSRLLYSCTDEEILQKYRSFIANPPVFDKEEGTYECELMVMLINDAPGHIYYTLDGSEPDADSIEYKDLIRLTTGKNIVRAIFVNERGIASESVSRIYVIEKLLPPDPIVTPESGDLTATGYIEVMAPEDCEVYYTKDGTMPGMNSEKYDGPILIPEGDSSFRFVCVNSEGKRSNITTASYNLKVDAVCRESDAINFVLASYVAFGRLSDISGLALDGSGIYKYECLGMASSNQVNYYVIEEYFTPAGAEKAERTGEYVAIDSVTGVMMKARKGSDGHFIIEPFA